MIKKAYDLFTLFSQKNDIGFYMEELSLELSERADKKISKEDLK